VDDHYALEATDDDPDARRIVLSGEIDLGAQDELLAVFARELAGPSKQVIVDLTAVTFLDSTGINALLTGHRDAQAAGKGFVVVPGSQQVMHALTVTGVDQVLDLTGQACA
jgi:anti-anti-sigma factor